MTRHLRYTADEQESRARYLGTYKVTYNDGNRTKSDVYTKGNLHRAGTKARPIKDYVSFSVKKKHWRSERGNKSNVALAFGKEVRSP